MPWPAYSTRFVSAAGQGWYSYSVPVGKRAVVKTLTLVGYGSVGHTFIAQVGGRAVVNFVLPGSSPDRQWVGLLCVAYGGESVALFNGDANMESSAQGYLLDDPAAEKAPQNEHIELERPTPLPQTDEGPATTRAPRDVSCATDVDAWRLRRYRALRNLQYPYGVGVWTSR